MDKLFDFIPSRTVREWLKAQGKTLEDWDAATIIYHGCQPLAEKHGALETIAEQTVDAELKRQIGERLAYDRRCQELFAQNDKRCFYSLEIADDEAGALGHFATFDAAIKAGKGQNTPFFLGKYRLLDLFDAPAVSQSEKLSEIHPIAEFYYTPDGAVRWYWTGEPSEDEQERVDSTNKDRFEWRFVHYSQPFERGDIVCVVGKPDAVGVVETPQVKWKSLVCLVAEHPRGEDFSDSSIVVEFLTKNGDFSHDHVPPIYLEKAELEGHDKRVPLLEAASRLLQGQGSLDELFHFSQGFSWP